MVLDNAKFSDFTPFVGGGAQVFYACGEGGGMLDWLKDLEEEKGKLKATRGCTCYSCRGKWERRERRSGEDNDVNLQFSKFETPDEVKNKEGPHKSRNGFWAKPRKDMLSPGFGLGRKSVNGPDKDLRTYRRHKIGLNLGETIGEKQGVKEIDQVCETSSPLISPRTTR